MKKNNQSNATETMKYVIQGGVVGCLVLAASAFAASCMQIDAYPKVADYYNQYKDYRNQYEQLMGWKDSIDISNLQSLLPEELQSVTAMIEDRKALVNEAYKEYQSVLQSGAAGYGEVALGQIGGSLERPDFASSPSTTDKTKLCYQIDMGAAMGFMAQTGRTNRLADQCGPADRQNIANRSIRPSNGGAGMAPNTAQATEPTRAVLQDEYSLLDVVRGDLAWIRDNPSYWAPFRYDRAELSVGQDEVARHSNSLQRVGAIMAGRGLAASGYGAELDNPRNMAEQEAQLKAAQLLGRLGMAYDGLARYATVYPRIAQMRDQILDIDSNTIETSNEGERYGISVQLTGMQSELAIMRNEAMQRQERLYGVLLSDAIRAQSEELLQSKP